MPDGDPAVRGKTSCRRLKQTRRGVAQLEKVSQFLSFLGALIANEALKATLGQAKSLVRTYWAIAACVVAVLAVFYAITYYVKRHLSREIDRLNKLCPSLALAQSRDLLL